MRTAKIDVTKIPKEAIFIGKKGKYIDIVLMENKDGRDQYDNDGFIAMSVSKADREAGVKGVIIGNWKRVGQPQGGSKAPAVPAPSAPTKPEEEDDVPFNRMSPISKLAAFIQTFWPKPVEA